MATAELTLHSQAVHLYNGAEGDGISSSGRMYAGNYDSFVESAIAIRFALPESIATIESASLNLWARSQQNESGSPPRYIVGVLNETSQVLPTVGSNINTAAIGSETKSIGVGPYTPPLDNTLTGSFAWIAVDITDMMIQALSAGRFSGGYVVILIQVGDFTGLDDFETSAAWIESHGLTDTNEPTIDLDYSIASPPPENLEGEVDSDLDDWTLTAQGDKREQIGALEATLDDWTIEATGGTLLSGSLNKTLDAWTVSAFGSLVISGQSNVTLDDWTTDATGHIGDSRQGALEVTLDDWTTQSTAMIGVNGRVNAVLDSWTITAVGTVRSQFRHDLYPATLFPDSLFAG